MIVLERETGPLLSMETRALIRKIQSRKRIVAHSSDWTGRGEGRTQDGMVFPFWDRYVLRCTAKRRR